ncbi:MAG TPA: hypothetical protein VGT08_01475 [Terracidiphilus sp.]|nr:hypothetical protein [Terracidiphilus sp.]
MENTSEPRRDFATEAERILHSAELHTQEVFRPLGVIAVAIIQAATRCRDYAKTLTPLDDSSVTLENEILLFFEFVYIFAHIALRKAFGNMSNSRLRLLQDFMLAMIPVSAIDVYFYHLPQSQQADIEDDFIAKLDRAEIEYGNCTSTWNPTQILTALSGRLRVALPKQNANDQVISTIVGNVAHEIEHMQLDTPVWSFANLRMSEPEEMRMSSNFLQLRRIRRMDTEDQ